MMEGTIRAFIAIEPTAQIRSALGDIQSKLQRADLGAKVSWVKPGGIHITLRFLGDVPSSQVEEIGSAMGRAAGGHSKFRIACGGVGVFPESGSPRVVWAGVTEGVDSLSRLSRDINMQLSQLGFPPEDRAFKAHLTLGRVKSRLDRSRLLSLVEKLETPPMKMVAEEVILFRSDLRPQGAIYTSLKRIALIPS
jgi:2'-5' RNA ligase